MIAIHNTKGDFGSRWAAYCRDNNLPFVEVDCYSSDIVEQLRSCRVLLWQVHQNKVADRLMAKQLLFALEGLPIRVFPNPQTVWHFDDKVAQKYLFEAVGAPLVPSTVFYRKQEALRWLRACSYPKVFKLRGGAGSLNVRLVKNERQGRRLVKRAFGRGFSPYNGWRSLVERWRHFRQGKDRFSQVLAGVLRLFFPPAYARMSGRERGYVYFQDFIPNNQYDVRVNCVNDRLFAARRGVRPGDFRASGSGLVGLEEHLIPKDALQMALDFTRRLGLQSAAYDFVFEQDRPLIVEVSCVFGYADGQFEWGYWDHDLVFHRGSFNPFGWIIEQLLQDASKAELVV